jgi:hypothetical protein
MQIVFSANQAGFGTNEVSFHREGVRADKIRPR